MVYIKHMTPRVDETLPDSIAAGLPEAPTRREVNFTALIALIGTMAGGAVAARATYDAMTTSPEERFAQAQQEASHAIDGRILFLDGTCKDGSKRQVLNAINFEPLSEDAVTREGEHMVNLMCGEKIAAHLRWTAVGEPDVQELLVHRITIENSNEFALPDSAEPCSLENALLSFSKKKGFTGGEYDISGHKVSCTATDEYTEESKRVLQCTDFGEHSASYLFSRIDPEVPEGFLYEL